MQEYKYLGVIFDQSGTYNREIKSKIIQARRGIALMAFCKDTVKTHNFRIYETLIKAISYMVPKHGG